MNDWVGEWAKQSIRETHTRVQGKKEKNTGKDKEIAPQKKVVTYAIER